MSAPAQSGTDATLVAIAKDERPYLLEWIAFHLSIGFAKIVVYDNASSDGTKEQLDAISRVMPNVEVRSWTSDGLHDSPQVTAYNHALGRIDTTWVMFLDLDEFLVPYRDLTIRSFLELVPSDAASIHFNWRGFGSSGLTSHDYGFVTEAFTRCAHPVWSNNYHFKTIARTALAQRALIHDIETQSGRRLLADLAEFETVNQGLSNRISHEGIQINHYQCKTFEEFRARMERGDANYHPDHWCRKRDASFERFRQLDENNDEDLHIRVLGQAHRAVHEDLLARLQADVRRQVASAVKSQSQGGLRGLLRRFGSKRR